MATSSVNPQAVAPATQAGDASPVFQSFNLHPAEVDRATLPGGPVRDFAEYVSGVSAGVRVIVQLALDDQQRSELREFSSEIPSETDDRCRRVLMPAQVWSLQRLALFALDGVEQEASRLMQWAYKTYTVEGKEASNKREG